MSTYQVIVGNIGTVYDGSDSKKANAAFNEYKQQSTLGYGRAGGERVTLMGGDEPIKEFQPETVVIFRMFDGQCLALFPAIAGSVGALHECSSYAHSGQHGAADLQGVMRNSRAATPDEYADLKEELENNIGYNLRLIQRSSRAHCEARRQQLKR